MERQFAAAEHERRERPRPTARPGSGVSDLQLQRMVGNQGIGMLGRSGGSGGDGDGSSETFERRLDARRGSGVPLPDDMRSFMESRIGAGFGGVRLHADGEAAAMSRAVGAQAFTSGGDIYFGAGRYRPDTREGGRLLAHELVHTVQQGASPSQGPSAQASAGGARSGVIQRTEEDLNELHASDRLEFPEEQSRVATPNPTAPTPPTPLAPPGAASFAPLSGQALTDRRAHGMSTDSGPMIGEIETVLHPTGGANPACTPMPANFETTVATALSTSLTTDVPSLAPAAAPDPMAIATSTANVAMPIINTHYSPHAPSVSAASFMANVSRKSTTYADPIRNTDAALAEFLEWYAGARSALRTLTSDKCGMGRAWWVGFAGWLGGAGASWNAAPHNIRERSALYDTYNTSVTQGGRIQFGLGFRLTSIPHTVTHEAMHLFQHADLRTQVNLLPNLRSTRDIIIEGFAEYLARGVRDQVITALQAGPNPPFSSSQETTARQAAAYQHYFDRTVEIRDILYRHGQDGEEAIRRAFFLGEGWRFGLLENAAGDGSPIESDRAIPPPVDVRFGINSWTIIDPLPLAPITAYASTRSVARVAIVGRTDPTGNPADNQTLGQQRADAVQAQLVTDGVPASRITATSGGSAVQIPGGNAANRRATVTVTDTRNEFPGLPGPGRP